jgi:aspartate aminotransferase
MVHLSNRINRLKPSATVTLKTKAIELKEKGHAIIDLTAGEPDLPTPQVAKDSAIDAIEKNQTHYTAIDGIAPLKESIVKKFKNENSLAYDLNQVVVTAGGKHALYNAILAVCNSDDEVIIPAPYWVSYPAMAQLAGAKSIIVSTEKNNFKLSARQLESTITPKTKLFILNSPSNPSGAVYSKNELQALGKVLKKHPKILVLSDDIYEHICWHSDGFNNIINVCPALYDRTVIINGVSKGYAMTGWRLGYAAGPKDFIAAMKKLQSHSTTCACSISQIAAKAALDKGAKDIAHLKNVLKKHYDYLYQSLNKIPGIKCAPADGALYCFANIKTLIKKHQCQSDVDFAEKLLKETGVVVVPGSAFGSPGFIRLSYTADLKTLRKGVGLLSHF